MTGHRGGWPVYRGPVWPIVGAIAAVILCTLALLIGVTP